MYLAEGRLEDAGPIFERSIDIQIFRLRQKIEKSGEDVQLIKTQRGAGYIFTPEVKPIR